MVYRGKPRASHPTSQKDETTTVQQFRPFYQQSVMETGGVPRTLTVIAGLLATGCLWERRDLLSSVVYTLLSLPGFRRQLQIHGHTESPGETQWDIKQNK